LSGGDDPVDPLDLPDLDDLLTEIDSQLDGLIEERDFWKQRAFSLGDNGSDFIERKTLERRPAMTNRINVLWAIPPLLPFALATMIRLLWCILGPPWEPDAEMAAVIIYASILLSLISVVVVGYTQSGGGGIWWTFKKEKSDD
jgi:hypothetical protein